jgi:hypothetical protein
MMQDTTLANTHPTQRMGAFLWRFSFLPGPSGSAEHKWMNRGRLALIAAMTVAQVAAIRPSGLSPCSPATRPS